MTTTRELLAAFVAARVPDTALVFVGDGPEKNQLRADARAAAAAIHFLPFANQTEMPSRYLLADVFVLPSRGHYETWGLAVNEAMRMGVPCIVSDRVGCQRDLVQDGVSGWVFPHDDAGNLAATLRRALEAIAQPGSTWRERARERVGGYTFRVAARGLFNALEFAGAAT